LSKLDPTQTIITLTDDIPWRVPDLAPPNSVAEAVMAGSEDGEGAYLAGHAGAELRSAEHRNRVASARRSGGQDLNGFSQLAVAGSYAAIGGRCWPESSAVVSAEHDTHRALTR